MARDLRQHIHHNAATLRAMRARIHETFAERGRGPEELQAWKDACAAFHASYDTLAFPGGYQGAWERVLSGDPATMEAAIVFLELRPYFFRSGYMHKRLLRYAKRAPLSKPQAQRLAHVEARLADWRVLKRARRLSASAPLAAPSA